MDIITKIKSRNLNAHFNCVFFEDLFQDVFDLESIDDFETGDVIDKIFIYAKEANYALYLQMEDARNNFIRHCREIKTLSDKMVSKKFWGNDEYDSYLKKYFYENPNKYPSPNVMPKEICDYFFHRSENEAIQEELRDLFRELEKLELIFRICLIGIGVPANIIRSPLYSIYYEE